MNEQTRSIIRSVSHTLSSMRTLRWALLLASAPLALAACGSEDPQQPAPGATDQSLTCGSSALYAAKHDACVAMDAKATADESGSSCYCMLGFAWNGSDCVGLGDCRCTGADCGKLTQTREECLQAHASCTKPAPSFKCGSVSLFEKVHGACEAMDAAATGENGSHCNCMMGFAWNGKECVGLGDCQCTGADCDKLTKTIEECQQKHAACITEPPSYACGSSKLFSSKHEACEAMDAKAAPDENGSGCYCMLGYAWNGTACEGLGNCRCVGTDCDKLTQTIEECQQKHGSCAAPSPGHCGPAVVMIHAHEKCTAMDATGSDQICNCAWLGYKWDGHSCVGLGDSCTCTGTDCDKLTETKEQCESLHAQCAQ
ncbi:MAG: hypothetical protein HY898_30825 [Deltaproteobacteria bacterium]|nr:hypothetical protein [Deltaproteobacteria bacterium]